MQNLTAASRELFRRSPDEVFGSFDDLYQQVLADKEQSQDRWHSPLEIRPAARDGRIVTWQGAKVKNVVGMGEVSAAGLPGESGVLMVEVPADSAAGKAGLRAGDVILKAGDTAISTIQDLTRASQQATSLKLEVWRDQQRKGMTLPSGS